MKLFVSFSQLSFIVVFIGQLVGKIELRSFNFALTFFGPPFILQLVSSAKSCPWTVAEQIAFWFLRVLCSKCCFIKYKWNHLFKERLD